MERRARIEANSREAQKMKLLLENWRKYLNEDVDFLLENARIGDISGPNIINDNHVTYDLIVNNNPYVVKMVKKSHGAPWDVSFNEKGAIDYELTGRGEVFSIVNSVIATVKDFINHFPNEKSFVFSGAEEKAGEAGDSATRRTKAYIGLLTRAIKKDPEIADKIEGMGDMSWAGQPNTFKINLHGWRNVLN